jgi:hypothetical protein
MRSKTVSIVILFIGISLALLFLILWLIDFSQFNIPELISWPEARVYGVMILISFILVFIFLQKILLKTNPQTSIWKLIIASAFVSFISLLIYQGIRQFIVLRGQYSYNLGTVFTSTLPSIALIFIAASIALELKKIKGFWWAVPTGAMVILFYLTKPYFDKFEW